MNVSPLFRGALLLRFLTLFAAMALVLACGADTDDVSAAESPGAAPALESEDQKVIYALGVGLAQQIKVFNLTPEEQTLMVAGLTEALQDNAQVDIREYQGQVQALAQERFSQSAQEEATLAANFMEHMAGQAGAEKLPSGMIMLEMSPGSGDSPTATSQVKVHYHGTLRSGQVFDSSVDRGEPVEFGLNQVIPCWTEGLQRMKVGGKSQLVCPPELAYGSQGRPPQIPANAALAFEVELLEIVSP